MDRSFDELEAIVRHRICSVCTERTSEGECNLENPSSCALFRQPVLGSDTPTKHLRHGHVVVIGHVLERPYDSHGEVDREFDDIPRKLVAHIRSFRRKFFVDGFINSFIILSFIC